MMVVHLDPDTVLNFYHGMFFLHLIFEAKFCYVQGLEATWLSERMALRHPDHL